MKCDDCSESMHCDWAYLDKECTGRVPFLRKTRAVLFSFKQGCFHVDYLENVKLHPMPDFEMLAVCESMSAGRLLVEFIKKNEKLDFAVPASCFILNNLVDKYDQIQKAMKDKRKKQEIRLSNKED